MDTAGEIADAINLPPLDQKRFEAANSTMIAFKEILPEYEYWSSGAIHPSSNSSSYVRPHRGHGPTGPSIESSGSRSRLRRTLEGQQGACDPSAYEHGQKRRRQLVQAPVGNPHNPCGPPARPPAHSGCRLSLEVGSWVGYEDASPHYNSQRSFIQFGGERYEVSHCGNDTPSRAFLGSK